MFLQLESPSVIRQTLQMMRTDLPGCPLTFNMGKLNLQFVIVCMSPLCNEIKWWKSFYLPTSSLGWATPDEIRLLDDRQCSVGLRQVLHLWAGSFSLFLFLLHLGGDDGWKLYRYFFLTEVNPQERDKQKHMLTLDCSRALTGTLGMGEGKQRTPIWDTCAHLLQTDSFYSDQTSPVSGSDS